LNVRNGVGILPDGKLIFAISKDKINFYDFANYFKKLGYKNALYLDGSVSKTYLPKKNWNSIKGNFGVIIGETREKKYKLKPYKVNLGF
jgi:prepilin-type processing-associated H-X9-DG protein